MLPVRMPRPLSHQPSPSSPALADPSTLLALPLILRPQSLFLPLTLTRNTTRQISPSGRLRWFDCPLPAALSFTVDFTPDGLATRLQIPRQRLLQPSQTSPASGWLPRQSIPILTHLQPHRSGRQLSRYYFFRCPGLSRRQPCPAAVRQRFLFLYPSRLTLSRGRFLCRYCFRSLSPACLPTLRTRYPAQTRSDARDPFSPDLSLRRSLRAIPLWLERQTAGKEWTRVEGWEGELVEELPNTPSIFPLLMAFRASPPTQPA